MSKRILQGSFSFVLLLLSAASAFAAADFYGVKMTSEYHAKDLVVDESGASPTFNVDKPGMDKRIYATASLSGRNLRIQVFNRSEVTIQSDYDTAEYTVVTHDGERHTLKPRPLAWTSNNVITPNKTVTFDPSFQGRAFKKEEIRAIICSFELGDMKIILLPLTDQHKETKPVPAAKPEPATKIEAAPVIAKETAKSGAKNPEEKKTSFFGNLFASKNETKPALKKEPKAVEVKKAAPKKIEEKKTAEIKKQTPKKIEVKKAVETKKTAKKVEEKKLPEKKAAVKPAAKPAPVAEPEPPAKGGFLPVRQAGASGGKKIMTAKPVPAAISGEKKAEAPPVDKNKILDQYEKSRRSRKYWRVEEVRNGFLVINLGAGDGLKPGATVQIARDGAFLAQAEVRSLSQSYATATVSDAAAPDVKAGDDVLFFNAAV